MKLQIIAVSSKPAGAKAPGFQELKILQNPKTVHAKVKSAKESERNGEHDEVGNERGKGGQLLTDNFFQ